MPDVGINIKATENVSNIAPQISSSLRNISSAAKDMKESLQLGDLEQKYKSFADRVDRMYDMQRAASGQQAGGAGPGPQKPIGGGPGNNMPGLHDAAGGIFRAGGVVQSLGSSGDVVGQGGQMLGQLGGMLKGVGGIGGALGGIAAVGGAVLFAGNKLVEQYEKTLPTVIELTGQLGRLGDTAEESSMSFRTTLDEVASKAAEFGYTLEEGAAIYRRLAKEGVTGRAVGAGAYDVMEYARGFGASPEALAKYLGMGRRFGQGGNLLGMAAGGLEASGMNEARYQEFLDATLSIFEEGLSRGVIKGFDEIIGTQSWLAQLGELFTGQQGLQIYKKMESAVVGATALGSETDAIMFRAARKTLERNKQEGQMLNYIDVMEKLEKGVTGELFGEVKQSIMGQTTSPTEQVEMMRQIFGVSYTTARKLMELKDTGAAADLIKAAPKVTDTPELRVMSAQLDIMKNIQLMGSTLIDEKAFVLEGAAYIVRGLAELMGADIEAQKRKEEQQKWEQITAPAMNRKLGNIQEMYANAEMAGGGFASRAGYTTTRDLFIQAIQKGVAAGDQSAMGVSSMVAGLSPEQQRLLAIKPMSLPSGGQGTWLELLTEVGEARTVAGERKGYLTEKDMPAILSALANILSDLNRSVAMDKNTEIHIQNQQTGNPSYIGGF